MAFGTITVKTLNAQPPEKPPIGEPRITTPPPMPSNDKAASEISISIVAPNMTQAEDFICGVYFNLIEASAGTSVSVYTHEFTTVTRLAEIKSELETASRKPAGTELKRVKEEDTVDLSHCSITLGLSDAQSQAIDIIFSVITPSMAGGADADATFALLDLCAPDVSDTKAKALQAAGNGSVYWIVTGFEETALLWGGNNGEPPKPETKRSLREKAGVPCISGDHVVYAQTYGGIRSVHGSNGDVTFVSNGISRDYAPSGCHIPVLTAVDEILRHRANRAESPDVAANTVRNMFNTGFAKLNVARDNWCEFYPGNGESKTI